MNQSYDLKNSYVCVTGGCGFIGYHLVQALVRLGVKKILIIDNLIYGDAGNFEKFADRVDIVQYSIGKGPAENLVKLLKGIDFLFHLAAEKHKQGLHQPTGVLDSNIYGTYHLLEAAVRCRVKKVVYSSSIFAYGRRSSPPLIESESANPATIYGISKLAGEHMLAHFSQSSGMKSVALRIFFAFGPYQYSGMGYKSVIIKNFEKILRGQSPLILGDGNQVLDYVYIDDVVASLIAAMKMDVSCELINVGSGIPISINQLTELMLKVAGVQLSEEYGPADETAGTYRVADTKKMKGVLGIVPRFSREEGLLNTFEWIKSVNKPGSIEK